MAERSYDKVSYKSNPVGIRFNLAQEKIALTKSGKQTRQQLVDYLLDNYVNGEAPVLKQIQAAEKRVDAAISNHFENPPTQTMGIGSYVQQPLNKVDNYKLSLAEANTPEKFNNVVKVIDNDRTLMWKQKLEIGEFIKTAKEEKGFIYND